MLVRNTAQFDTRVQKEAAVLAARGYEVQVFALAGAETEFYETKDGVVYRRAVHSAHDLMRARDAYLAATGRVQVAHRARMERATERAVSRLDRQRAFVARVVARRDSASQHAARTLAPARPLERSNSRNERISLYRKRSHGWVAGLYSRTTVRYQRQVGEIVDRRDVRLRRLDGWVSSRHAVARYERGSARSVRARDRVLGGLRRSLGSGRRFQVGRALLSGACRRAVRTGALYRNADVRVRRSVYRPVKRSLFRVAAGRVRFAAVQRRAALTGSRAARTAVSAVATTVALSNRRYLGLRLRINRMGVRLLRSLILMVARTAARVSRRILRVESSTARAVVRARRRSVVVRLRVMRAAWRLFARLHRVALPIQYHRDYLKTVFPALADYRPDVVHAHDLNTLHAATRYALAHSCRLVYDAHELELHRNATWTRLKRAVARHIETVGIRKASAVITVSPGIADFIAETYGCERPHVILNSPPLVARELSSPVDLKAQAGLTPDSVLLVYVGKALRGRGLEQLIDALALLPTEFNIGILGPRDPVQEPVLLEQAARLGVERRLHLFDPLPAIMVPAALRTSDGSVNPLQRVCLSYELALPNKHFDAVMAGVPIAVSDLVELGSFVRTHGLGVAFDETSPVSIAGALRRMVEGVPPGIRDRDRLRALQSDVCWDAQAEILVRIYESILGARAPRSDPLTSGAPRTSLA
jgi:glycosyltransferase involved in cell wall biosynthesis